MKTYLKFREMLIVCCVILFEVMQVLAEDMKCTSRDNDFKNFMTNKLTIPIYNKLQKFQGKSFTTKGPKGEYSYTFAICAPPTGLTGKEGSVYTRVDSTQSVPHTLGVYSETDVSAGSNWVMLKYNGTPQDKHDCSSSLMIICNPHVLTTEVQMKLLEGTPGNSGDCNFLFEIEHPDICMTQFLTFSLSIGSILVITFLCVLGVYLIGGAVYMRVVRGAKGWQQIPNWAFWQDFGNLQADGCNFLCRTSERREDRPYKGIGDDQIDDLDRIDPDDHLLPM